MFKSIKIIIDNDKIIMRKVHSKEEVLSLINSMPKRDILWIDDERERNYKFKLMLKTGDCEDLIVLIKSIYINKKKKTSLGKKINKADDEIIESIDKRYGKGSKPKAIILTHGHFDHVGALEALLDKWDVPVYAHELGHPPIQPGPRFGGSAHHPRWIVVVQPVAHHGRLRPLLYRGRGRHPARTSYAG